MGLLNALTSSERCSLGDYLFLQSVSDIYRRHELHVLKTVAVACDQLNLGHNLGAESDIAGLQRRLAAVSDDASETLREHTLLWLRDDSAENLHGLVSLLIAISPVTA